MRTMTVISVVILSMLGAVVSPCNAQTINGCYQKNNGQLRIVADPSECRPPEVAISWNQSGQTGPQGPQGPQGPRGLPGNGGASLGVYDNNNNLLGPLTPMLGFNTSFVGIFSEPIGKVIAIDPATGEVPESWIMYNTSNCSDTGYISVYYSHTVIKNGSKFYTGEKVAPIQFMAFGYYREKGVCSSSIMGLMGLDFAVPVREVSLPFPTPVALPLDFKY